jgi:purine-nucleoside phosphorylase
MRAQQQRAAEAAAFLRERVGRTPEVGILTGTGLGAIADAVQEPRAIPYGDIPHFRRSTVASHAGQLVTGDLAGRSVAVFQGRFHLYEGYSAKDVTFPVRVLQDLGAKTLVVTNAAGGINPAFSPGDVMILADHVNLTGENPLVGENLDEWGLRFPDMGRVYDAELADRAEAAAAEEKVSVQRGVYAGLKGPSLETPAEVRYLRTIGADAVGFSTVMEAIAAVHAGMRILGLSMLTNIHHPDHPHAAPAVLEEIIAVADAAAPRVAALIRRVVEGLDG